MSDNLVNIGILIGLLCGSSRAEFRQCSVSEESRPGPCQWREIMNPLLEFTMKYLLRNKTFSNVIFMGNETVIADNRIMK